MATTDGSKYERVGMMLSYLHELTVAQQRDINCYSEIRNAIKEIEVELIPSRHAENKGGKDDEFDPKSVDLGNHISHHALIAWDEDRKEPVIDEPKVENCWPQRPLSVSFVLGELAKGKTVHQLCGDFRLDINQVSGAVIFAAYVVSNRAYEPVPVPSGTQCQPIKKIG